MKRKRSTESENVVGAESCLDECGKRQLLWMNRSSSDVKMGDWRPITIRRVHARKWIMNIDLQVQVSTALPGLSFFHYDPSIERWKNWRTFPCLGLAFDCGSDGVSGFHALCYGFKICCWGFPDQSHAAARAFDHVAAIVGLKDFILLMLVSLNLEFGPDNDQGRKDEIRESLRVTLRRLPKERVPLFREHSSTIIHELESSGVVQFDRHDDVDADVTVG